MKDINASPAITAYSQIDFMEAPSVLLGKKQFITSMITEPRNAGIRYLMRKTQPSDSLEKQDWLS